MFFSLIKAIEILGIRYDQIQKSQCIVEGHMLTFENDKRIFVELFSYFADRSTFLLTILISAIFEFLLPSLCLWCIRRPPRNKIGLYIIKYQLLSLSKETSKSLNRVHIFAPQDSACSTNFIESVRILSKDLCNMV